jgi:ferredoxin--NADP+ reductase
VGLRINVDAVAMGQVALFSTDRTLTGQEGIVYPGPPASVDDPPSTLAARLFESGDRIEHVHVMSNMVSVRRSSPWDEDAIADASKIIEDLFVFYRPAAPVAGDEYEQLRADEYNATITAIRAHNEDLWVMRIKPDEPIDSFDAGQYTTLALGYWEPRADEAIEDFDQDQRRKMARRSYSVSSSMFDDEGELVAANPDDVEFYIVKVRPGEQEIPALTPRIFMKGVGDRIFMGRKFTGHYTLEGVRPTDSVVFLATGTGEAPQNTMSAELFRRGHEGRILSVVCVRYNADLAYMREQAIAEERFTNYKYLTLTTREPDTINDKVYIQDMILSGRLEEELGAPLDPETTHVFLCGNPAMIGLPKWEDDEPRFPEVLGVCQILHDRGFTIDHRRTRGNVHYEEYWKDR